MNTSSRKLPRLQIVLLALCRLTQPLAITSILVFLPEYLQRLGVHADDVAFTAGIIAAIFSLCESATAIPWSVLSDLVGRKPVLLGGLIVSACSNVGFGFCSHLWQMMLYAGMAGVASGNVGVMRTAMAELVPQEELQAKAFAVLPAAAGAGFILGPSLGGFLSQASKSVGSESLLYRYPYALPAIATVSVSVIVFLLSAALFQETQPTSQSGGYVPLSAYPLRPDDEVPLYHMRDPAMPKAAPECSADGRSVHLSTETWAGGEADDCDTQPNGTGKRNESLRFLKSALVQPFDHLNNVTVWSFTLLTLSSAGYDNLLPVFLHYDDQLDREETYRPSMGLGKDTKTAGIILTCYSLCVLVVALFLNPLLCKRWSPSQLFRACLGGLCTAYVLLAVVVAIPHKSFREAAIYGCMFFELCCSYTAIQNCLMLMTRSVAPQQLASMNGLTATLAGIARSVGVIISGLAFSASARSGFVGGPWWAFALITAVTCVCSLVARTR